MELLIVNKIVPDPAILVGGFNEYRIVNEVFQLTDSKANNDSDYENALNE